MPSVSLQLPGLFSGWWRAQSAGDLKFDVASVKPSVPPEHDNGTFSSGPSGGPGTRDPGLFKCERCSLALLIKLAFGLKNYQLSGPPWLDDAQFEVSARVPSAATRGGFRIMLQNLLIERFQMIYRREKKEMPVYQLTVMKDRPKLRESAEGADMAAGGSKQGIGSDGFPIFPVPIPVMNFNGRTRLMLHDATVAQFAELLSSQLNYPVIDSTGLSGKFEFRLYWSPDGGQGMGPRAPEPSTSNSLPDSPQATLEPILHAVQEQLGLRLQKGKDSIDVVIVDRCIKSPLSN